MKRVLVSVGVGLACLVASILVFAMAARFADGPLGPFPGGPMSGESVAEPVRDWTGVLERDRQLELQVNPSAPRSITTTSIVHEGRLYAPSLSAARKRWPAEVENDPRVILRIDGRLHPRRAVRVTDPDELRALVRDVDGDPNGDLSQLGTWYFRLDPPAE